MLFITNKYGVYFLTTNAYLENQVKLIGESSTTAFTKHARGGEYTPKNY